MKSTHAEGFVFWDHKVVVLIDDALCSRLKLLIRFMFPPVSVVAILIKLSSPVIESMCDLVADDVSDGTIVQVIGTILVEEDPL